MRKATLFDIHTCATMPILIMYDSATVRRIECDRREAYATPDVTLQIGFEECHGCYYKKETKIGSMKKSAIPSGKHIN